MRIKITNPKYGWHTAFYNQVFEVCEGNDLPDHHQYPVMTRYGRTWFDKDAVTVLESDDEA
jgi:hypothetical protein